MTYKDCKLCNNTRIVLVPTRYIDKATGEETTLLALMACPAHGKEPDYDPAA